MDKSTKKFNSRMQASLLLVFCIVTLALIGLIGKLVYIVEVDGDRYTKRVLSRQTYVSSVLPFQRGDIMDVNGTLLAHSELHYRLILDSKLLLENEKKIKPTMELLKKSFDIDAEEIQKILDEKPDSQYTIVKKNLKYDIVQEFLAIAEKNKEILGIWFEEEYVRTYPYKTLASDILGFTSADNIGFFGIEEYYNDELNGTNGREYRYFNSELDIKRNVKKAVNGNSIVTTINLEVQRIIQEKINKFNTEIGSKDIGILVMDPNDGSIIAMASTLEYDLNSPRDLKIFFTDAEIDAMTDEEKTNTLNSIWKNDIISSGFEPGSTFKPVTVGAALEENVINENSTFICDGYEIKGNRPIKCAGIHNEINVKDSIAKSCNDAMMHIADLLGKNTFYKYEKLFSFGEKTGIDLPGEAKGQILGLSDLGETGLATSSFGQSTSSTMLQIAAAFSSVVNGGYYYQPHVMKQIVNDNGATIKKFDKVLVRQTVSEKTSKLLQEALYQTVETGTAKGAQVEGYTVGGKTGTAQKLPREDKKYIVSFIGCSPAINPQAVIYVKIDEPNVEKVSSSYATNLAGEILNEILPILGVYPEGEIDYLLPTTTPTPSSDTNTNEGNAENNAQNAADTENSPEGNNSEERDDTEADPSTEDTPDDNTGENSNENSGDNNNSSEDETGNSSDEGGLEDNPEGIEWEDELTPIE